MTTDNQPTIDLDAKLDELMQLPPAQRLELDERLIESVPLFGTLEAERAWNEKIARRIEDFESGREPGIPAEVVHEQIRERLRMRELARGDE